MAESGSGNGKQVVLTTGTLVPIAVVAGVVGAVAAGAAWATKVENRVERVSEQVSDVREDVRALRTSIDEQRNGYLTTDSFDLWLQVLQAKNPELNLPERRR